MNPTGILTNSFKTLILLLLLQNLDHPVSQGMLLIVSPMILIVFRFLSHLLRKRNLKRKNLLIQLIFHFLRILLPLLLLRKSIFLYLLFPIGLKRNIKLMLRREERSSLKSKSTFLYSMLFNRFLHMLVFLKDLCTTKRVTNVSKRLS